MDWFDVFVGKIIRSAKRSSIFYGSQRSSTMSSVEVGGIGCLLVIAYIIYATLVIAAGVFGYFSSLTETSANFFNNRILIPSAVILLLPLLFIRSFKIKFLAAVGLISLAVLFFYVTNPLLDRVRNNSLRNAFIETGLQSSERPVLDFIDTWESDNLTIKIEDLYFNTPPPTRNITIRLLFTNNSNNTIQLPIGIYNFDIDTSYSVSHWGQTEWQACIRNKCKEKVTLAQGGVINLQSGESTEVTFFIIDNYALPRNISIIYLLDYPQKAAIWDFSIEHIIGDDAGDSIFKRPVVEVNEVVNAYSTPGETYYGRAIKRLSVGSKLVLREDTQIVEGIEWTKVDVGIYDGWIPSSTINTREPKIVHNFYRPRK